MKSLRNYLFVESEAEASSTKSPLEKLAETFCRSGYVYLARKGEDDMQDTTSGVRLMPYKDHQTLPYLDHLEAVVVSGDAALVEQVSLLYPGVSIYHWSAPKPRAKNVLRPFAATPHYALEPLRQSA